ncbi:MutS-related protein [Elizabethkingia anophelis]|uniref:MutS-related protein n=1 Tax=Elizabethkingia anophelis TaxID=1117645 RepID=UPI00291DA8AF|nr:MAG: hypothetical protein PQ275_17650 [Elizabethkingia anophelis]
MTDTLGILEHFNYVQTRKSKQYLLDFFNKDVYDIKQTLYTQEILKLFLENFNIINSYKINDNTIVTVQRFLDEINVNNYNFITRFRYRRYFKDINTNLLLFINLFYYFGMVLRSFISLDICILYSTKIKDILEFIDSFSVNNYYNKDLDFEKRKNILKKIEINIKNKNFEEFWNFFFMFDVYSSISKGIKSQRLVFPYFNSSHDFVIEEFYHMDVLKPIKNSIKVEKSNTVIFTGANMSGKSTAMKSISSVVLLAHLGIAVPATYCNIPFYDKIFLFFSVNDDIKKGHSFFVQEIINLKKVLLELKSKKCFAVFDEIFKGTNINDATAITINTIKGLNKFDESLFVLSTHLNTIEDDVIVNEKNLVLNLECFLENENLLFTYKLKKGWAKIEVGKILFEKYGLKDLLNFSK